MSVCSPLVLVGVFFSAAPPAEVETDLKLEKPVVEGTGPFTVTVKGTVSLSKDEKEFIGVKASNFGKDNFAFVNLPDASPKPGGEVKRVIFTWKVEEKGLYEGVAEMHFKDAKGRQAKVKVEIPEFEVK